LAESGFGGWKSGSREASEIEKIPPSKKDQKRNSAPTFPNISLFFFFSIFIYAFLTAVTPLVPLGLHRFLAILSLLDLSPLSDNTVKLVKNK
jgi:hypothetical protein